MKGTRLVVPSLVVLCASLIIVVISAASSTNASIRRSAIVGSSGVATIGEVRLTGSMGQAIIGSSAGASTQLHGGYWSASSPPRQYVWLPIIQNDHSDSEVNLSLIDP